MWLPPVTTTAPATGAVMLAAAKEFMRIAADDTSFDVEMQATLDGVIADVERITGTRLITQTVLIACSGFADLEALPIGPVSSVSSVKYLDQDGVEQTLASDDWRLSGAALRWRIDAAIGSDWPSVADAADAVRISLIAGYGAAPSSVPPHIRTAILRATRAQFDDKPFDIEPLLVNDRIWL